MDDILSRLAGAPISWGVCEVPGWGLQLPPERVLAEMAAVGLRATELGAQGWLPARAEAIRAQLGAHGLALVGGFVPLVLHRPTRTGALAEADRIAAELAAAGATTFVAALVSDEGWSAPGELDDADWGRLVQGLDELRERLAGHGLDLAVHPHWGTLLEREESIARLLEAGDQPWCLDTGHLLLAGLEPAAFARAHGGRVSHVHLKDVDAGVAARLEAGELSLVQAVQAGLFRPLGEGDARIDAVLRELDAHGYEGWLVLEQDTAITGEEPPVDGGPVADVRRSIDHLTRLAPHIREGVV